MTEPNTLYSRTINNFFGIFNIIPGQYIHLDNQLVEVTKKSLKITINSKPDKIYVFEIGDYRLLKFYGSILPMLQLNITGTEKYNVQPVDPVETLINDILDMRTPNIFYLIYDNNLGTFSIKDTNMSTLFMMEKVKSLEG